MIPEFAYADELSSGFGYFVRVVMLHSAGRIFYPVGGFLADVFFGRYRVIHISLWLYWVAFALLAIGCTVRVATHHFVIFHDYFAPIISYVCIVIASGSFQSTIIPFGADQLEAASSNELSSYFYWYYFAIQIGSVINIVADAAISLMLPSDSHLNRILQALIALSLVSLALVLHKCLENCYFRNIVHENCIRLVGGVMHYVATVKRQLPQNRRAFRYGEERMARIELAKLEYDGIYTRDQVEDVKTFCRICLVLFSLSGLFFSMPAGDAMLSYRLNKTLSVSIAHPTVAKAIPVNIFLFINTISVALSIPLVNHILVPCVPSIRIKEKIGIGMAMLIVAVSSAAYLEWAVADEKSLNKALYFIIPAVLLSIQETFTFVSVLEFIYAQSPESMKGMLTGICYFMLGIMSRGASVVFFIFVQHSSPLPFAFVYFYIILCVFSVLGFVAYILVACLYTNRQRPVDEDEDDTYITLLYNNFQYS